MHLWEDEIRLGCKKYAVVASNGFCRQYYERPRSRGGKIYTFNGWLVCDSGLIVCRSEHMACIPSYEDLVIDRKPKVTDMDIIEQVELRHGSGKAMQVADILNADIINKGEE